jgi:hypothetical protein
VPAAGATFFPLIKLDVIRVRDKVDCQLAPPELPFAAEVFFVLGRKAVGELELVAKNKIQAVK